MTTYESSAVRAPAVAPTIGATPSPAATALAGMPAALTETSARTRDAVSRRPGRRGRRWKNSLWVLVFLLPSAVPLIAFTLVPMVGSLWVSLHKWNLISPMEWVGLDNYTKLLAEPSTRRVFGHTLSGTAHPA